MSNIQPTMENFNKNNSKGTLDLRPEGHEAATEAARAKKEELLAKQAATSIAVPKGMDIKPTAPSKGFNQVPGINSRPTGEADVFKLNPNELESPQPQTSDDQAEVQSSAVNPEEQNTIDSQFKADTQEAVNTQPTKKPGFFGRIFGKK